MTNKTTLSIYKIWRYSVGHIESSENNTIEDAERGEAIKSVEKTPLLSRNTDETTSSQHWVPSIFQLGHAALMSPVYSVLIFLPMLPFWIFAGFLVYLLGSASNNNFYMYCGVLTVVMPFNIVGTLAILRRVWFDMYGG